jgi:hypothetical protein
MKLINPTNNQNGYLDLKKKSKKIVCKQFENHPVCIKYGKIIPTAIEK